MKIQALLTAARVSDFRFRIKETSELTKKEKKSKKTLYYRNTKWKTPKKKQ